MGKIFTFKNKRHLPKPLAWLLVMLLKLYAKTLRVTFDDPEGWLSGDTQGPCVLVLWHNRIFLACLLPRKMLSTKNVLISQSRDGEYISTIVSFFGLNVVRGSSSKGAVQALEGLRQKLCVKEGIVLTVDGPRGPRYTVHAGAAELSRSKQVPIVPITFNASRFWMLHSWDGTQIPKPFSKVTLCAGKGFVPEKKTPLETIQQQIAEALHGIDDDNDL